MKYQWATASHTGLVRSNNEDAAYPTNAGSGPGPVVVMVADGMGGHIAGEVASRIAVETAVEIVGNAGMRVVGANNAILSHVAERPDLAGMGTTLTLAEIGSDGVGRFAHVGDSRGYLLRSGTLRQLTNDHTVAAEYIAAGTLSPEEAMNHPQRNMITRALGLTRNLLIDEFEEPLEDGDRLLLCSDGLTLHVADDSIAQKLADGTAEEAAWQLVESANAGGGHDNITVLVLDVEE